MDEQRRHKFIRGREYDVTQYQNFHPGGAKIMKEYEDQDATDAFEGHSAEAELLLDAYAVSDRVDQNITEEVDTLYAIVSCLDIVVNFISYSILGMQQ